jgi:hypothetical protein
MAQQNKYSYNQHLTENHHKANLNFISKLDFLCRRDGAKRTPFSNETCIDIDAIETARKTDKQKTVDLGFIINNDNTSKLVLCELRLKYKNPSNLSKSEIEGKIRNSINLMGQDPSIYNDKYLVFDTKIINQAKSILRRLFNNKKIAIKAVQLDELKEDFFL